MMSPDPSEKDVAKAVIAIIIVLTVLGYWLIYASH